MMCLKVVSVKDLAEDSPLPWYLPLDSNQFSLNGFRLTRVGRFITHMLVRNILLIYHVLLSRFVVLVYIKFRSK